MSFHPLHSFRRWWMDRLVLRPTRDPVEHGNQSRHTFDWNGKSIEYFEHPSCPDDKSPSRLILKFPGTGGRAERASRFPRDQEKQTTVWTWNPPGYGASEGRASLQNIADASIAFAWHAEAKFDSLPPIWLVGNSLGCCVALHVASQLSEQLPIDGMILRNPPPLIPVVMNIAHRYPGGRWMRAVAESLPPQMNATETISRATVPTVFIQSGSDRLVLPSFQNELLEKHHAPHQKVVLEGLDHHEIANEEQSVRISQAIDWLSSQSAAAGDSSALAIAKHSH